MEKSLNIKKICALALAFVMVLLIAIPTIAFAATRQNNYPIVLCHGYRGWGRDENLGTVMGTGRYYWGGDVDLQQKLIDAGYTTYTAAVGPYSSNWDRACELYAQIKGGTVDYGQAHSQKYGHARYGRTYAGMYSQWGTKDASGKVYKIHLLGHSQGGQSVRTLMQLLAQGSAEERAASGSSVGDLFKGGKAWVHSVTSLASPHNGTTMADQSVAKIDQDLKTFLGTFLTANPNFEIIFDYKLDQWGIKRQPGESFLSYMNRAFSAGIWDSNDSALYDLSTNGGFNLNNWVKAQSNVYYFSWACEGTIVNPLSIPGHHIADPLVMSDKGLFFNPIWAIQAASMGSYTRNDSSYKIPVIDSTWWPNDGYVPTISQSGPKWGSTDTIVNYNGTAQIGKWNFMGTKHIDHEDIIGRNWSEAPTFFINTAKMLGELPKSN